MSRLNNFPLSIHDPSADGIALLSVPDDIVVVVTGNYAWLKVSTAGNRLIVERVKVDRKSMLGNRCRLCFYNEVLGCSLSTCAYSYWRRMHPPADGRQP